MKHFLNRHGKVIIDKDPNLRAEFTGKVLKQYFDFSIFRKRYLNEAMPLFDQDIMLKLVSELRKSIIRLREISKLSQKDFLGDQDKIGSSKYHFIVAIESTIDMCNHIIARNGYRMPENYADTFKVMAEASAIDADFSNALRSMAKFRNRLVNLYWEVDDQQLYKILQEHLVDFKKILNSITDFLEWEKY